MTDDERETVRQLAALCGSALTDCESSLASLRRIIQQLKLGAPARELLLDEHLSELAQHERALPAKHRALARLKLELLGK